MKGSPCEYKDMSAPRVEAVEDMVVDGQDQRHPRECGRQAPEGAHFILHAHTQPCTWSDAPNKWSIFSIVNKSSYLHISMTKGVQRKNSSDLSLGRRPVSKSEEFFLWTTLVIEIQPPQPFLLLPKRCTLYRSITPSEC